MDKLKSLWGKVGEKWLTVVAVIATYVVAKVMGSPDLQLADILIIKVAFVTTLLAATVTLLYFLRGTDYDVLREIFDEANTSAAIFVAGIMLAIALAIGS